MNIFLARPFIALLVSACLSCLMPGVSSAANAPGTAAAKDAPPATGVPWSQLAPEQQRVLEPYRERWNQLPPERQQAIARGAERWQQMSPEQ